MAFDAVLEARIREHLAAGDVSGAAEALFSGYGSEIYGFLIARLPDRDDADMAFSMFCEDLLQGLPQFRGDASLRTWSYRVARHAGVRLRRGEGRRRKRFVDGASTAGERVAWKFRTETAAFRRTDVKNRVRALYAELDDEDRELLMLRVDRELDWREIARVVSDGDVDDDDALDKLAAACRKRFERAKDKLRALATAQGLIAKS